MEQRQSVSLEEVTSALGKADTYIPMAKKTALVEMFTGGCIKECTSGHKEAPPYWMEDSCAKSLILCYTLAGLYLHLLDTSALDAQEPTLEITIADYDRMVDVSRLLEHVRGGADHVASKKAKDILADFRDFEKRLNTSIHGHLAAKNDVCGRLAEMMRMLASPGAVRDTLDELKRLQGELEAEQARMSEIKKTWAAEEGTA